MTIQIAKPGRPTIVSDPRGRVAGGHWPLAPRKQSLEGLRLGILDNAKWNANKLLRGASRALSETVAFADTSYYVKDSFSKDAAPELIDRIAGACDIVMTAIGDCGSCCSCCIRDAVALERRGVPSAVIITTEFVHEAELTLQALGMPDLAPVTIEHPVSSITAEDVARRVAQIAPQAQAVWLGGG